MNKIKLAFLTFAVVVGVATLTPVSIAGAATAQEQIRQGANQSGAQGGPTLETRIGNITSILLFVIGAVSVVMIIVGGIKYVISNGDSSKVKTAKDTIMYAVVGLVVALVAYAVVNFVLTRL